MAEHNQQFDTFTQWVSRASTWLTRHEDYDPNGFAAICFDAKGRHCRIGRDFMRADKEGTFPVKWLWPDQISELAIKSAFEKAESVLAEEAIEAAS
jgi:hypothetical protein